MTAAPVFKIDGALGRLDEQLALQDGVVVVQGSGLTPEPIAWLWQHWLALGKLHILAGPPGQGKTTLALAAIATLTGGGRWPDGSRCDVGNALIWSGEDDPADTLVPRLMAMGADMSRVYFVKGTRVNGKPEPFDPARDMVALAEEAERIGSVRLLMVDPVVSAVAGDGHKNTDVRRGLQPLVDLGATLGAAVLGISHFTKGSSGRDPTERVTGSVAFSAVARVVLVACKVKDEEGEERRILVRTKSNIGPDDGGFAFDLDQVEVLPGIQASRIEWGQALAGTARELLREPETPDPGDEGSSTEDAVSWLRDFLKDGPMLVPDIRRCGDEAGFTWRTIQRAMRRAGAESRRTGFQKPGEWFLTTSRATVAPLAPRNVVGANGAIGAPGDDAEAF